MYDVQSENRAVLLGTTPRMIAALSMRTQFSVVSLKKNPIQTVNTNHVYSFRVT